MSNAPWSLHPTAVKTANYTAAVAELVPCDPSAGSFTVTLPPAPVDEATVGVKVIAQSSTPNTVTVACGAADTFNKTGGSTTLALSALFLGVVLQYSASAGVWYLRSTDPATGQPGGAASLGSDGKHKASEISSTVASVASDYAAGRIETVAFHNDPQPNLNMVQLPGGRTACGVSYDGKVACYSSAGLYQYDTIANALAATNLRTVTLPANTDITKSCKVIWPTSGQPGFGKMFLLAYNTTASAFQVFSATPVTGGAAPSWSAALVTLPANATLIMTAFRACSTGILVGTYSNTPDITGGPLVARSTDGVTFSTVLGPLATGAGGTRHIHGIYEDPYNLGTIYVTVGDYFPPYVPPYAIYKSTDGGATFAGMANFAQSYWQAVSMGFDANYVYCASDQVTGGSVFIFDRVTPTPKWYSPARHDDMHPPGAAGRSVSDVSCVNAVAGIASAQAAFSTLDIGRLVSGGNSIPDGAYVQSVPTTTVAAGSNGATLPQATINVASTAGFTSGGGAFAIATASGTQIVTYTGVTGTTFTGCAGGTGTLATGGAVTQAVLNKSATGTTAAAACTIRDSFYVNAYAGAMDPVSGWFYTAANDASVAGNVAGIFMFTQPGTMPRLLQPIFNANLSNFELFLAGGYAFIGRYITPTRTKTT